MSLVFNGNSTIDNVVFNGNDVEKVIYNGVTVWEKTHVDYKTIPLTFKILSDGEISWYTSSTNVVITIQYSKDNGSTWASLTPTTSGASFNVSTGDVVQFKGSRTSTGYGTSTTQYHYFTSTANFNVYGNIMSLCSTNFSTYTTWKNYQFFKFFTNCGSTLKSAKNLILPFASTTGQYCCAEMFKGCNAMAVAPTITSTSGWIGANNYAFSQMFQETSITETPTMTISTINMRGCYNMFYGCSNLTDSHISFYASSSSVTVGNYGLSQMFYNCKKLVNLNITSIPYMKLNNYACYMMYRYCAFETAPDLPATTIGTNVYYTMFSGNTKLKHAPTKLPATTLYENCYRTMFSGCTNLENAPELPATTLATSCYHYMFTNCSKINYIKCLATTNINTTNCNNWVSGVAASGTFVKASSASWGTGVSAIPSGWTVQNA